MLIVWPFLFFYFKALPLQFSGKIKRRGGFGDVEILLHRAAGNRQDVLSAKRRIEVVPIEPWLHGIVHSEADQECPG